MDPEFVEVFQAALDNEVVMLVGFFVDLAFMALGVGVVKKVVS